MNGAKTVSSTGGIDSSKSSPLPIRSALAVALTIAFVAFVLEKYGTEPVLFNLGKISASRYLLVLGLLILNQLLSSVRFYLLLKDLGTTQSFAVSHRVNILSVLGGALLFNYFGQSLTRSALLKQAEKSPAIAFILTGLERIVSLAMLLVLAVGSALVLFRGVHFETDRSSGFFLLIVNLAVVSVAVILFGLKRQLRRVNGVIFRILMKPMFRTSLVTAAMHATMLMAYIVLATALEPQASLSILLASSLIVMFAASLPISLAGWGIREFSAAYAFSAAGLKPEAGLTIAAAIGMLSIVALAANIFVALIFGHDRTSSSISRTSEAHIASQFTRISCWIAPLFVATFIVFQVRLPTNSGWVTVNLADPFAIVGGCIMAALLLIRGQWKSIWLVPGFNIAVGLATVTVGLGFLHGWAAVGLTDWALYNRFWGWFVLLCYLMTGALITAVAGRIGLVVGLRAYLVACAAVVLVELCLRLIFNSLGLSLPEWSDAGFEGMIGNRNALGFQLVLAFAVGMADGALWGERQRSVVRDVLLGLILAGVAFTGSRAAALALGCVIVAFVFLGRLNFKHLLTAIVIAGSTIIISVGVSHLGSQGELIPKTFADIDNGPERTLSISSGWELFARHPFIGAGLGVFMQNQIKATGIPLSIHSSYLWLLAELGVVGFLAFMFMPASLARSAWLDRAWLTDWPAKALLGCVLAFAVMSIFHELVYQRTLWFLMGALLAIPKEFNRNRLKAAILDSKAGVAPSGNLRPRQPERNSMH